ncbi:MAG TPA: DNA-directed RNA polymerase subunit beta', partial [Campylobacterales bacterium]|nr:DNA-directed RNA polymerase subunit beta' [Campylobacterales bacterium]
LSIDFAHEEVVVTVTKGKEVSKFMLRKSDIAKPNELAGISGKVDGKLYIPHSDGDEISENDSIVEVIKEAWNIPHSITFASKLLIEDGAPVVQNIKTRSAGTVKYYKLVGDYLDRFHDSKAGDVVTEKGLFSIIVDSDGREATRYYIPRDSILDFDDNSAVNKGDLIAHPKNDERVAIAEWDPYSTPIIAEVNGTIALEDIEAGLTVVEQTDELSGKVRLVVNEYIPAGYKPAITLATSSGEIKRYFLEPKTSIYVANGDEVNIADTLASTPKSATKTHDITGGLPRVSEVFEARKPKASASISEVAGTVRFGKPLRGKERVIIETVNGEVKEYMIDKNRQILVHAGEFVQIGEKLTDGEISSHDILRVLGEKALHYYIVSEIQQVYRSQGVAISDKHIEVIISQMLRQVKIVDSGNTNFIVGDLISKKRLREANDKMVAMGGEPAIAEPTLLGVTRAAISSDSIISAASFQETTKVLTEASIAAKTDHLEDLKENVILGRMIPVGTGLYNEKSIKLKYSEESH